MTSLSDDQPGGDQAGGDQAGPRWSLRTISSAELKWAFSLQVSAMGGYIAQSWGWDEATHRKIFAEEIFDDLLRVIEVGGRGAGLLRVEDHPTELKLEIMELAPQWQGKGIGSGILSWLLEQAQQLGKPLTLTALTSDPRAIAFYQRHGLTIVRSEPNRVFMASKAPVPRTG